MYGTGLVTFLVVVIGVPAFLLWYEKPTCFDGVKNQGEDSVDRGGPCMLLDASGVQNFVVLWARAFEVVPGVYNAVAQVDNPNFSAGVVDVPYSFKLFDGNNILIAERKGRTFISPNKVNAIFEGGIETGERVPTRTFFEFLEPPQWERVTHPVEGIQVKSRVLSDAETQPRLTAVIENTSFKDAYEVEVVAIIFNARDVAVASSKTVIEILPQQSSKGVTFTWPKPFLSASARIEVLPQVVFGE